MAEPSAPLREEVAQRVEPPARARKPGRARKAALALAALGLLAAWGLGASSLAGEPRNSLHQEGEDGLRSLALDLQAEGLRVDSLGASPHALDAFDQPERTVLVVAGVERPYTPGEVQAIVGFVARGGIAVIADDLSHGDRVSQPFGVNFDKRVLRDASFKGNQSLVQVNATAGGRNFTVIMNVPSSLGFGAGVPPRLLAESGLDSYIDTNPNGIEDPEDTKGPFPVIASVALGKGQAVFASDPGLFLNGLNKENSPFLKAFFRSLLPEGGTVAFDESRHPQGLVGSVLGAALAGEVQASSEGLLAAVVGAGGVLLALLLYAGWKGPADLTEHRSHLDDPVHAQGEELRRARAQRLAVLAVADANNLGIDALEHTSPQQLAAMANDPVLAQAVQGQAGKATPAEVLERVKALQKPGGRR
jgi:hypothetical protein